jgi:hypothetical protein
LGSSIKAVWFVICTSPLPKDRSAIYKAQIKELFIGNNIRHCRERGEGGREGRRREERERGYKLALFHL